MAISKGEQNGNRFGYYCLSGDVAGLDARAKQDKCWTGSWAYVIDTGAMLMYDAENERWVEQ